MDAYEVTLLMIGAVAGVVAVLGGYILIDRIREWRWRKWHR